MARTGGQYIICATTMDDIYMTDRGRIYMRLGEGSIYTARPGQGVHLLQRGACKGRLTTPASAPPATPPDKG